MQVTKEAHSPRTPIDPRLKKNTHCCRCEVARHDIEIRAGLIVAAAIVSLNGEGVVSGDASICDIRFIDAVWCETLPARSHRLTCKHQSKTAIHLQLNGTQ
jgi:hypothetical protein